MKLFTIHIENPLKTWWKARKYFKFPRPKLKFFFNSFAIANWRNSSIVDIDIHDLYWKDKYNSPRHEISPIIYFCLFGILGFTISFPITYIDEFGDKINYDMVYWEYLLDYLYYTKSLELRNLWTTQSQIFTTTNYGKAEDGSEDIKKPLLIPTMTHLFSLNKRGLKEFKKLYVKRRNTQYD